jgi:hypothetical protein
VIRRKRKRNYEIGTIGANQSATETAHLSSHASLHNAPGNECYDMLPHLIEDQILPPQDQAGVRFDDLNPQHKPPEALSSLSELNSAMWFDARDLEKEGYQFFLFREQTSSWVDCECTINMRDDRWRTSNDTTQHLLRLLKEATPSYLQPHPKCWNI